MDSKKDCEIENKERQENQARGLVGRFVQKEFAGHGLFLGKVVSYLPARGFFRVRYEDGDSEDLELHEVGEILVADDESDIKLNDRKRKLQEFIRGESRKRSGSAQKRVKKKGNLKNETVEDLKKGPANSDRRDPGLGIKDDDKEKVCAKTGDRDCKDGDSNVLQAGKLNDARGERGASTDNFSPVEDLECKAEGPSRRTGELDKHDDGTVSESKCVMQERLSDSDEHRALLSASSELPCKQSRPRRRRKSGNEMVVASGDSNACERKSDEIRVLSSSGVELPRPSRRRGRPKSGFKTLVSPQGSGVCEEIPGGRARRNSQSPIAVSLVQRTKRPRRNSANNPAVHISCRDSESDCERHTFISEESYLVGNGEFSSANDASGTEDSGQISVLPKAIDLPLPPLKPLPASSGDIPIPEKSVPDLFSVYTCLRSFSDLLFLSPFSLGDFVGALNYKSTNSLLDAVHVCLLRASRRHLEMLSTGASDAASKCLRQLDWSFLDAVTWPVYLVEYLVCRGFSGKYRQKIGQLRLLDGEYNRIPPSIKLSILQFLCDDIMEAEEVRTEVNMRVNLELDMDVDGKSILSSSVSGLVEMKSCHSKSKRISHIKADEQRSSIASQLTVENPISHSELAMLQGKQSCLQNGQNGLERPGENGVEDWNSDECRLCGMDGNLICCDGCPAAYHSRCVGLSKALLPEGAWYCPECVVEKRDAKQSKALKGLRGAESFGIDPYERAYFGTCGYLLVSDSASNPAAMYRYYNKNDVIKLLQTSYFSAPFYDAIRSAIVQYWDIIDDKNNVICPPKADTVCSNSSVELSCVSISEHLAEQEEVKASGLLGVNFEEKVKKFDSVHNHECFPDSDTANYKRENEILVTDSSDAKVNENKCLEVAMGIAPNNSTCFNMQGAEDLTCQQQVDLETDSRIGQTELIKVGSVLQQQTEVDMARTTTLMDVSKHISRHEDQQIDLSASKTAVKADLSIGSLNWELSFKPYAYVNHYVLGDMAASAAANLTVMGSEENRLANRRGASKKSLSATISEQVKSFSKAAVQFCWPSSNKRSMEVPKEKCGWCVSCKSSSNRRGCLLNVAAGSVMAGAASVAGGLRPTKNGEGHLPAVAAYILYIEDCLRGLMGGPWENPDYRKHWRKRVEQASNVRELRASLLELESNIRLIALSAGWNKYVDDWSPVVSVCQIGANTAGPIPKRGGGGKRSQKHSAAPVILPVSKDVGDFDIYWWRGGRLSNQLFQRGILPCMMAKQAGRQGGFRRIPGISYSEGSEVPKRSRLLAWRASVEMARSVSQLAVQVRYLDAYIRWEDLAHREDYAEDGKVADKEVASFRKSILCEKRLEGGEVKYLLDFGNQKSIPVHAVKHSVEIGETQVGASDGRNKYWLGECHVPLYLLKGFEEKLLQARPNKGSKQAWKDQNRALKATTRKDVFAFLLAKAEMHEKCSCTQCRMDVLIRNAVQCKFCQGSLHRECTRVCSSLNKSESKFTCFNCYNIKLAERKQDALKVQLKKNAVPLLDNNQLPEITPPLRRDEMGEHKVALSQSFGENVGRRTPPVVDSYLAPRKKLDGVFHLDGLLWRKNKANELGMNFRKNKLLLACQNSMNASEGPVCFLCREPYNPELMYIGCEHCKGWFHGDAFGLTQENIVDLVGFKCHKCRKKSAPVCPYVSRKKLQVKRSRRKVKTDQSKVAGATDGKPLVAGAIDGKPLDGICSESRYASDNSFTTIAGEGQVYKEMESESNLKYAPQASPSKSNRLVTDLEKLKNQMGRAPEILSNQLVTEPENVPNSCRSPAGIKVLSPQVDWDFSVTDCLHDEGECFQEDKQLEFRETPPEAMEIDTENEPQTMFSFTELLASEDNRVEDLVDLSQDISRNWSDSHQSIDKEITMSSQPLATDGHSSETMISSNSAESMNCQLANECTLENPRGFQLYDARNTFKSDKMGKSCTLCTLTEVPPDIQCRRCGLSIHSHCYEGRATGIWTSCGWICDSCQHNFVQI